MMRNIMIAAVGLAVVAVMAAALFTYAPSEGDETTDVIIIMGQSNADYREQTAVPSEASPYPPAGRAWYYGTEQQPAGFTESPAQCAAWPISTDSGARIGDKWPAMAAEYIAGTGHSVAMFALAVEGVSIKTFEPGSVDGHVWAKCEGQTKQALDAFRSAGMHIGRISVVWIQGEQDDNDGMGKDEYEARMLELFENILNGGLGVDVDGPIWICKVRQARAPVIAAAQVDFCEQHPGIARIATEAADGFTIANGLMTDRSHYTQAGNNIVGAAVGEALADGQQEAAKKSGVMWVLIGAGMVVCVAGFLIAIARR